MDFVSLFNNLHIGIRNTIVSFVAIMPFWFFALELFSKSFVKEYDFYIHIIAAFCLTLSWMYAVLGIIGLTTGLSRDAIDQPLIAFVVFSIGILGCTTVVFDYKTDNFKSFLAVVYVFGCPFIAIFCLGLRLSDYLARKRKKRSKTITNNPLKESSNT